MKRTLWVALATLLAAAPGLQARQHTRVPDPADPAVTVPPVEYVSAMTGHTASTKDAAPPDKAWRRANEVVGGQSGHASDAGHAGHASHAVTPAPTQAPPRPAPAPAPAEHHKHH